MTITRRSDTTALSHALAEHRLIQRPLTTAPPSQLVFTNVRDTGRRHQSAPVANVETAVHQINSRNLCLFFLFCRYMFSMSLQISFIKLQRHISGEISFKLLKHVFFEGKRDWLVTKFQNALPGGRKQSTSTYIKFKISNQYRFLIRILKFQIQLLPHRNLDSYHSHTIHSWERAG